MFVLSSPLETMSLPLENSFLRQLWTITQTLVDIVQLRMATLSMQVPVDEIQVRNSHHRLERIVDLNDLVVR